MKINSILKACIQLNKIMVSSRKTTLTSNFSIGFNKYKQCFAVYFPIKINTYIL